MENTALSYLHPFIKTKNDANTLIQTLGHLADGLFKESFNLKDILSKETSYDLSQAIEKAVSVSCPDQSDKNTLQAFFTGLQKELSDLPIIHIILPFSPKEKLVKIIHDWFYENFHKTVLLDISIDETIIGGSVISFKGRANDYTLKNHIDQMEAMSDK